MNYFHKFLWKTEVSTALGVMKKMWFPGEEKREVDM